MASVPQSSWFCTVRPSNVSLYSTKANPRNLPFKTLKVSSSSSNAEPSPSISSNPPENSSAVEPSKSDRLKLAFDKAKEYKESLKSNPTPKIVPNPVSEYAVTGSENGEPIDGVPLSVRIAMEKGKGYKENKDVVVGSSGIAEKGEAFSGTKKDGFVSEVKTVDNQELPPSVKLAMEKAKEFQNKGVMSSGEGVEDIRTNSEGDFPEVEILVGDPSKYGTTAASKPKSVEGDNKPKVSTWGTAPSPRNLSKTEGDFPEVDILVGDTTKFGAVRASEPKTIEEDDPDVYKTKFSTWGDSPSHRNISKAQGDFPEVEILVGDPRKFRTTASSKPESIDEYEPKVSTHGASPSSRNISKTEGDIPEVEILVGDPSKFGTATVSKPKSTEEDDLDVYRPKVSTWGASPSPTNISETEGDFPEVEILVRDPSKFGKAAVSNSKSIEKVYKPKGSTSGDSPSPRNMSHTEEDDFPEVETLVGDPGKLGTTTVSEPNTTEDNREVFKPKVSTLDASPSPRKISKMEGHFSEAEILVGKPIKFGTVTTSEPKTVEEDDPDIYKPNVSTWGVFPRPRNISKAYGGGRVIRPGEVLETAEVKAAKDVRTRELVAAYRRKTESSIDPKLKSECEEALKDGDSLMDIGKLKEALPFYETVMSKIPFESELHGLAALHWAICQDSLTRHKEARVMYGKLKSHPNVNVKKTAKQFFFSFQAMAMLKVKSTTLDPINLGYQNYFDAFVEDKTNYPLKDAEVEEGALKQALPYFIFLASPIIIVLLIALQKRI